MITREWLNYVQDSMLLIHSDFRSGVVVFCLFQSSHWAILSIVSKMSNEESLTFPLSLASNIRARKKRKTKSFSSCEYSERQKRERLQIAFILFYRRQMTSIEFFTAFCLYEMRMSARKIRASSSDAQLSHVVFHLVHISNVWWTRWNGQHHHVSARITSHMNRWEKRNYNNLADHDSHTMPPQHENSFPHRVYF